MIKRYNEFLVLEKTIGSEEIRKKWYSDIDKNIFYKIVNIDPTSIRKKEFSKPGKYCKWLLREFKSGRFSLDLLNDLEYIKKLNYFLFITTTGWWHRKSRKKEKGIIYDHSGHGECLNIENDILKYKLGKFYSLLNSVVDKYEVDTEKSKFDIVYSDDKINILIPINFSASYETAKNTDWCSQTLSGFSSWKSRSIMFRIMPIDKKYDKLKLTWEKTGTWFLACSKYPEVSGKDSPFDIINNEERWKEIVKNTDSLYSNYSLPNKRWFENSKNIVDTMGLVSKDAKECIESYYNKQNLYS